MTGTRRKTIDCCSVENSALLKEVRPGDILVRVNQTMLLSDSQGDSSSSSNSSNSNSSNSSSSNSSGSGFMSMAVGESHFDATIRALRWVGRTDRTRQPDTTQRNTPS